MSRCTTSSSNLRPIRRLIAKSVFCGLVTAWRLAGWPTSTSPSLVKATIEGVVRSPSLFSMTRGLPPSMIATHELVVPRSMPITLAMSYSAGILFQKGYAGSLLRVKIGPFKPATGQKGTCARVDPGPAALSGRSTRHDHPRWPQQPAVQLVPGLHHLQHRVRLGRGRFLRHHRLVARGVEGLAAGVDNRHAELLQRLLEKQQRRLQALLQAAGVLAGGVL